MENELLKVWHPTWKKICEPNASCSVQNITCCPMRTCGSSTASSMDDNDLATYVEFGGFGSPPARRQAVERGFLGTALTGVDIVLND